MTDKPKIIARKIIEISPWMKVIERAVDFGDSGSHAYHAVVQSDYVGILARTPDGRFPIVRQYRPAVEAFTWELPAGHVDDGEQPDQSAVRELLEETGYTAAKVHALGTASPCTGRMSNRIHSFFMETRERAADHKPEPGLEVKLVSAAELARLIEAGEFISQLHLGTIFLAGMRGFIELKR